MSSERLYSVNPDQRRINPVAPRSGLLKPDGTPIDNDRVEIGPTDLAFNEWEEQGITAPNLENMREFRLQRIVGELQRQEIAGVLLFDPLNVRYASDATNMQLWTTHNFARACFISADGYMILWDFHNCDHLTGHLPLIRELRSGASFFFFETGERSAEHAEKFADQLLSVVNEHAGGDKRIAIDKIEVAGVRALDKRGFEILDGQHVMELARSVKGEDEIHAMRCSLAATEAAMYAMQEVVRPGVTENDVWSVLHAENIRRGGEWIECRLIASGPRTNPWFQECGPRVMQEGDLLALDTDLVGPYGICSDLSRTWLVGDVEPTQEQRYLYQTAYDHIQYNMNILKPGMTFAEVTHASKPLPEEFRAQRYSIIVHGIGLCDEYPCIRYREDLEAFGYDGALEPGMTLCVEAYVGAVGGKEGVKLEDQIVITDTGYENLTRFPFASNLLE